MGAVQGFQFSMGLIFRTGATLKFKMDEANRICREMMDKYNLCMGDAKKNILLGKLENDCQSPFDDYRLCVTEVMRRKVSKMRERKET